MPEKPRRLCVRPSEPRRHTRALQGCCLIAVWVTVVFLIQRRLIAADLSVLLIPLVVWAGWRFGKMAAAALVIYHLLYVASGQGWLIGSDADRAARLMEHLLQAGVSLVLALVAAHLRDELQLARLAARRDPLTGLANRQAFFERAKIELSRARRFGHPVSVAVVDCDDLKRVNDELGHRAGDALLLRIAEVLRTSVRQYDLVSRLGGDEFALLLPQTSAADAQPVIERLQSSLRTAETAATPRLTVSAGVVSSERPSTSIADLLARADELMYAAKRSGKGTVRSESLNDSASAVGTAHDPNSPRIPRP